MTRIAYILKMYPRFSETFILNEILELERRGVDLRLYALRKPDDGRFHPAVARVKANVVYVPQYPEMEPDRVRAAHSLLRQAVPEAHAALHEAALALPQPYGLKRFLQAGVIAAHLLRRPVDALHAHFASSATRVAHSVSRLTGLPYSFTAHAKDIYHERVSPASLRAKIREARFVVTVSDYNQAYLGQLMGDEQGDIRRLYNGIDRRRFHPRPGGPGTAEGRTREPGLILAVGRLVEKKGFDRLIEAIALLAAEGRDFRCEIIGKGEQEAALRALINRLGLAHRVLLVGPRPQDKVVTAYRRAALFALPCVVAEDGNRDGLPTVLLEAMAAGLPVVSTTLTGVPEIVDHEVNGLLTPPGDVPALAAALARLLDDADLRRRYGVAGQEKVRTHFDLRRNVALLHRWLTAPAFARPPAPGPPVPVGSFRDLAVPPPPPLEEVLAG